MHIKAQELICAHLEPTSPRLAGLIKHCDLSDCLDDTDDTEGLEEYSVAVTQWCLMQTI